MSQLLFLVFLGVFVLVAGRFAYYFHTATATDTWGKVREAAGDSATYFVAKSGIALSALLGLVGTGTDFLATDPGAEAGIRGFLNQFVTNPLTMSLALMGMGFLVWWARSQSHRAPP